MNIKNKVRSAKCGVLGALVAVGLSAFAADPSVTVGEVTAGEPWSTITVNYTLGGVDAATDYKVAFDITAGGQTASVTNDAAKLTDGAATKEINTVEIFGKEVVDTKAKVKVSLIAVKASSEPEYVEIGGVKWATKNLGAEKVTDCGDYFAWGATELAYSSLSSKTFTFVASRPASYGGSGWTQSSGFNNVNTPYYNGSAYTKYTSSDSKTVLESGDDAATVLLGSGWRTPTKDEFDALAANCVWIWTADYNSTGKAGYIVYNAKSEEDKGKANMNGTWKKWDVSQSKYVTEGASEATGYTTSDTHIFFPVTGCGNGTSLENADRGYYWSSSLGTSNTVARSLNFLSDGVYPHDGSARYRGFWVRPVKD